MNPQKKLYKVPVTWQMEGELEIKAWNEGDALEKANDMEPPADAKMIGDTYEILDPYVMDEPRETSEKIIIDVEQKTESPYKGVLDSIDKKYLDILRGYTPEEKKSNGRF